MARNYSQTKKSLFLRSAAVGAIATLALSAPANAIVPNDNFSSDDILDTAGGVNGVGQFFRSDGFVCSGTLINPRTVLFAAHCVNSNPENQFSDPTRADNIDTAWYFNADALDDFRAWARRFVDADGNPTNSAVDPGTGMANAANPNFRKTNVSRFTYTSNQTFYNPLSLTRPGAFGFLEGDIALSSLDTPVANVPTWALLFSPLPDPGAIDDTDGTGYHVNITGYGRSGSGTAGATVGVDFRRRAAENMLGALTSFDDRNIFLFGQPFGDLPQVLYRLDFDDPDKTNPFDFNLYKDEPRVREGTTAGGDSGGPLILDAANNSLSTEDLQIGVLSGGSRFFGPQVFSSYGTESFYQPLFLFADYIAATNPYRYVSAKAGDGAWEDATHWQTDLDPNYRIINSSGAVVNGFPGVESGSVTGNTPQFGEVCFDPEGDNPGDGCFDFATGTDTPPSRPAPTPAPMATATPANVVSGIGEVSAEEVASFSPTAVASGGEAVASSAAVAEISVAASSAVTRGGMIAGSEHQSHDGGMIAGGENVAHANGNGVDFAVEAPHTGVDMAEEAPQADGAELAEQQPQAGGDPLPAPTLANGLAGATNFIPNNNDPDVANGVNGRYFEVTLNTAGTTTLSSTRTIDRLNVTGAAGLVVASGGNLTSNLGVNQTGGRVAVNGQVNSGGDYSLLSGVLSGTGTVKAPFLTNVAGAIAPGTMGMVGNLTIDGNAILSSGSTLFVDIGASGNSDKLTVTGIGNVGGNVALGTISGFQTVTPSTYRIVNAAGGVTGQFDGVSSLSAILLSNFNYSANAVDLIVRAQSYQNVVDPRNQVQTSFAGLMDRNRGNAGLAGLFSFLDFTDAATIQATFDSWAPTTESTAQSMARGAVGHVSDFHQNRLSLASRSDNGGTIAVIGQPVQLAVASMGGFGVSGNTSVLSSASASAAQSEVRSGGVNEDMAVYLAGGFINGDGGSMPLTNPGAGADGEDEFDGFFIAGGLEYYLNEDTMLGLSAYYSDVDANVALGQQAEGRTIMGSLYGRTKSFGGLVLDARISAGTYNIKTMRSVALGAQNFNLTSQDDSFVFASEVGLSKELDLLGAIIAPGIKGRAAKVNFDTVNEAGGGPALTIVRPDYNSLQGLAGVEFKSKPGRALQMRASMNYVHEFNDNPSVFGANFVGGNGLPAPFALVNQDRDWGEVGVGLRYNAGNISFDLSADSTVGRSDVDSQVYSGAVTFRF